MAAKRDEPESRPSLKTQAKVKSLQESPSKQEYLSAPLPTENSDNRLETENIVAELAAATKKYRDLYDQIPAGYATLNQDGLILEANNLLADLLKTKRNELLGQPFSKFILPGYRENFFGNSQQIFQSSQPQVYDLQLSNGRCQPFWVRLNKSAQKDEAGKTVCRIILIDITKQKLESAIKAARLNLLSFAADHSLPQLLQKTIDECEILTQSSIGFCHFVGKDQETLYLQAWSSNTLEKACKANGAQLHYPVKQAGVWVDCMEQRRAVIHNDYSALPHKKGLPPGHAAIVRELVVPIIRDNLIVAILGVGNKPFEYDDQDVKTITDIADLAWDIAGRKKAEEEHKEAEERFRLLFMNAPLPYQSLDEQGNFLEVNKAFLKALGYQREEVIGRNFAEFIDPDWAAHFNENFPRFKAIGEVLGVEFEMIKKDGTHILVSFNGKVQKDISNRFQRTHCIFHDITEQKRAEDELKKLNSLLDAIRKAQSHYIAFADPKTVFDDLLQELVSITESEFGFLDEFCHDKDGNPFKLNLSISNIAWDITSKETYEQLRGRNFEFRNLNNLAGMPAVLEQPIIANEAAHHEHSGGLPDGHPAIKTFMGLPVFADGKVVGVAGVANRPGGYNEALAQFLEPYLTACGEIIQNFRFRTKEQENARLIQESEEKYRSLFNNAFSGIYVHDFKGRIVDVNERACLQSGYTKDQLLALTVFDLHPGSESKSNLPAHEIASLWNLWQPGQVMNLETEHKNKDGKIFPVEISTSIVSYGGRKHILAIVNDITQRKQGELQARIIQKAESLNRMAGAIAHHYNNLLSVIGLNLDLALCELPKDSALAQGLSAAMSAVERATELGNTMLTYIGDKVSQHSQHRALDLSAACRQFFRDFRKEIPANIEMKSQVPEADIFVSADAGQVRQILRDLFINASEAIGEKAGLISLGLCTAWPGNITSANLRPAAYQPDKAMEYACIEVKDTGCGIDNSAFEDLFDPFYSTKFAGRGLGLPFALGAVKAHNGFIYVESTLGRGSSFKVFLPKLTRNPA